jgi:hypothetical protein
LGASGAYNALIGYGSSTALLGGSVISSGENLKNTG